MIIEDYSREVKFKRGESYQGFTNSLPDNSKGYYTEQLISGIDKFGGTINQFNPRTRELLYAILLNVAIVENRVHSWDISFYYKEIQAILGWDDESLLAELDVLQRYGWIRLFGTNMPETLKYKYKMYKLDAWNSKDEKELFDNCIVMMRIDYYITFGFAFLPSIIKYLRGKSNSEAEYKQLIKKMILDLDFTILN